MDFAPTNDGNVHVFTQQAKGVGVFVTTKIADMVQRDGKASTIKVVLDLVRTLGNDKFTLLEAKHFVEAVMLTRGLK